jgi:glucose-6-phosphate isomerase
VIEVGIYRAEKYGEGRRMLNVNVSSETIERTYAPTEENQDKYDTDALIDKYQSGESLEVEERIALANDLELFENSREVLEDEERFSHRSERD